MCRVVRHGATTRRSVRASTSSWSASRLSNQAGARVRTWPLSSTISVRCRDPASMPRRLPRPARARQLPGGYRRVQRGVLGQRAAGFSVVFK